MKKYKTKNHKISGQSVLRFYLFFCSSLIPLFLFFAYFQVNRYMGLKKEVQILEAQQEEMIENNKRLIAEISLLSSSERIETLAQEMGMSRAESNQIVRVKMEGSE
ncbi:MAG: hypothetical protein Ta2A_07350 [Treponemataceae bacterium]|nr:MAG: hypothetical protein Ta2A_07350 [Treponemataceae bacterium]